MFTTPVRRGSYDCWPRPVRAPPSRPPTAGRAGRPSRCWPTGRPSAACTTSAKWPWRTSKPRSVRSLQAGPALPIFGLISLKLSWLIFPCQPTARCSGVPGRSKWLIMFYSQTGIEYVSRLQLDELYSTAHPTCCLMLLLQGPVIYLNYLNK